MGTSFAGHGSNTPIVMWVLMRRPLSPPSFRPAKAAYVEADRAHTSPSEIPVASVSAAAAGAQPEAATVLHSKAEAETTRLDNGSVSKKHSSSMPSDGPGALKPSQPASSDSVPEAASSGRVLCSNYDGGDNQHDRPAYEPGYREGSSAQPEPWPPDEPFNGRVSSRQPPQSSQQVSSHPSSLHIAYANNFHVLSV